MDRRTFLLTIGVVGITASCRGESTSTGPADTQFAALLGIPADEAIVALGRAADLQAPQSLAHARQQIEQHGTLGASCEDDVESGALVVVDGWVIPTTMAGTAIALASSAPD